MPLNKTPRPPVKEANDRGSQPFGPPAPVEQENAVPGTARAHGEAEMGSGKKPMGTKD